MLRDGLHGPTIMRRLAVADGRIVSYGALIEAMYRGAREPGNARGVLTVEIHRLRKKLPRNALLTHVGEGYSLSSEAGRAWLAQRDG